MCLNFQAPGLDYRRHALDNVRCINYFKFRVLIFNVRQELQDVLLNADAKSYYEEKNHWQIPAHDANFMLLYFIASLYVLYL